MTHLDGYQVLANKADKYTKKKFDPISVISECFDIAENLPTIEDISIILEMIFENKEMPDYYSFEQRELLDPREIAKNMKASIDERKEFNIVENYYDLDKLLDQVISEYEFMNRDNLLGIRWTNKIIRPWFGLCQQHTYKDGTVEYNILINKLISSPDVPVEVIKYLIYHEMLHKSGFWYHDDRFRYVEWKFPNSEEWDGFLDEFGIRFNLDTVFENKYKYIDEKEEHLVEESIPDSKEEKEPEIRNHKFCRNCGNKLPVDAKFCDRCGERTNY